MKRPSDLGLPDKFTEWRRGQDRALRDLLFSDDRFNLLVIPVGGGKSLTYVGYMMTDDSRGLVVTATRKLQDQLGDDFESIGLVDIRGRSNYTCDIDESVSAAEAVCTLGTYCERMKHGGCGFYDQRREAAASRLVVSNYKFWLYDEEADALGHFPTIILDEAHRAPDEISEYAAVEISRRELDEFRLPNPSRESDPGRWALPAVERTIRELTGNHDRGRGKRGRDLQRKLRRLCRLSGEDWLYSRPTKDKWRWDLIDPGAMAEDLLFRSATKVVLSSATIVKKTLQMLGIRKGINMIKQQSTFPVKRRPIYYWPQARVGRNMSASDFDQVVWAMDEVLSDRKDRRAIVHSVSYPLGKRLWSESRLRDHGSLILHEKGQSLDSVLDRYLSRRPPVTLISPALSTGIDLPYDQCEVQIIPKMPFPDFSSPLVKARNKRDRQYSNYVTMQSLAQSVGRGMRAIDDQCETFILDAHFGWMRFAGKEFAPDYFHAAIKTVASDSPAPDPLPALGK